MVSVPAQAVTADRTVVCGRYLPVLTVESMSIDSDDLILSRLGKPSDELLVLTPQGSDQAVTYLDYAGTPPVCRCLLEDVFQDLSAHCMGNPHSSLGGPSGASAAVMAAARQRTLEHFHLSSEEYEVIFTSGATASMKLVGELFPWSAGSRYCFTKNAHTSLLGVRCYAPSYQTVTGPFYGQQEVAYSEAVTNPQAQVQTQAQAQTQTKAQGSDAASPSCLHLFGAPGECNFSGAKLNMEYTCTYLQSLNSTSSRWLWLLDAARLASGPCDLSSLSCKPHFIAFSYYKIFGYPTGLGALLVRRDVMPYLCKKYFGGGTLLAGAADSSFMVPRPQLTAGHFEDGTANFHSLAAVVCGFPFLARLGGVEVIARHSHERLCYLLAQMQRLLHSNGRPLCVIYSHHSMPLDMHMQGAIVAFNCQYQFGQAVGFAEVQRRAELAGIHMRTGCFCNLGACQEVLGISAADAAAHYALGRVCSGGDQALDVINNHHTGACRVSLGYGTTNAHCDRFIAFLQTFLDTSPAMPAAVPMSSERPVSQLPDEMLFWQQTAFPFPGSLPIATAPTSNAPTLQALYVYPIKSCGGMRVDHWPITPQGLLFDRSFALVNDQTGTVLTQKQCPRLALMTCTISFQEEWILQLSSPESATVLQVALLGDGEEVKLNICGRCAFGRQVSRDASKWFTDFIQHSKYTYSLVRNATNKESFANTAQYLMLSMQSVRALIEMMLKAREDGDEQDDVNVNHIRVENFRPNVVINCPGQPAHVEDSFSTLQIPVDHGHVSMDVTGPCARCLMVNVNSANGQMDCKVFEALKTYRYADRSVYFGQFLALQAGGGHPEQEQVWKSMQEGDLWKLPRLSVGVPFSVTAKQS